MSNNPQFLWHPSCDLFALKARAEMYQQVRAFFLERNVLEVETPILSQSTATDPFLESIQARLSLEPASAPAPYYLHTSPEFPMKRLLASGSGAIYQICKTFRNGESGRRHNPEFTMLEWYRPDYSLSDLMHEVLALVQEVLGQSFPLKVLTYRQAFDRYLGIDPFLVSDSVLVELAREKTGFSAAEDSDTSRDDYLNLLLSSCIEPSLGKTSEGQCEPCFLTDYPPSQASLAQLRIDEQGQKVAERFELYINGLELANGYFELTDANEQRKRFEADNHKRRRLGLVQIPLDENLLQALEAGMPSCAGVALGIDRLLMVRLNTANIEDVLSFPIRRA